MGAPMTTIANGSAIDMCDALVDRADLGTIAAQGICRIYDGPQPADTDTPPSTGNHSRRDDISGITQANPAVVTHTSPHGFSNGDVVYIANVGGMVEINDRTFVVAGATANTYELTGENSTGHGAYTSGGDSTRGNAVLAELPLSTPPSFGDAVDANPGGRSTANPVTNDSSANATGSASWFRVFDRDDNGQWDGSAAESGADMNFDNRNIVATQEVSITSWTVTQPET